MAEIGFISDSGGPASITSSFSYNKRLQPLTMSASTPSQTVFSIGYDFHAGNGTAGSGSEEYQAECSTWALIPRTQHCLRAQ
jgi:hypothetical protein